MIETSLLSINLIRIFLATESKSEIIQVLIFLLSSYRWWWWLHPWSLRLAFYQCYLHNDLPDLSKNFNQWPQDGIAIVIEPSIKEICAQISFALFNEWHWYQYRFMPLLRIFYFQRILYCIEHDPKEIVPCT